MAIPIGVEAIPTADPKLVENLLPLPHHFFNRSRVVVLIDDAWESSPEQPSAHLTRRDEPVVLSRKLFFQWPFHQI